MGKWMSAVALILLAAALSLAGTFFYFWMMSQRPRTQAIRWQYQIVAIEDVTFVAQMNILGMAEWEAVQCRRVSSGGKGPRPEAIMEQLGWDALPPTDPAVIVEALNRADSDRMLYECVLKRRVAQPASE